MSENIIEKQLQDLGKAITGDSYIEEPKIENIEKNVKEDIKNNMPEKKEDMSSANSTTTKKKEEAKSQKDTRDKIYEGKAKIIYDYPEKDKVIQYFKDSVTAFNSEKLEIMKGKGVLCCKISSLIYEKLNDFRFNTHFIKSLSDNEQLVKECDVIPVEVIVRNFAAGSFAKRWGKDEGEKLPRPLIEFSLKDDDLGDPMITEDEFIKIGEAKVEDLNAIKALTHKLNYFLMGFFAAHNLYLYDFKIELGIDQEQNLIIADEISPDTCRIRDMKTLEKFDKDIFRKNEGDLVASYTKLAKRLGVL